MNRLLPRAFLLLAVALLAPAAAAAKSSPPPAAVTDTLRLTLDQAIQRALAHSEGR